MITFLPYLIRDKIIEYCSKQTMFELSLINSKYRCLFHGWLIKQQQEKTKLKRQKIEKYLTDLSRLRRWNGQQIIRSDMTYSRGTLGFDFATEEEFLDHNLDYIRRMNGHNVSLFHELINISERNHLKHYESEVGVIGYTNKICFDHENNLVVMGLDI